MGRDKKAIVDEKQLVIEVVGFEFSSYMFRHENLKKVNCQFKFFL